MKATIHRDIPNLHTQKQGNQAGNRPAGLPAVSQERRLGEPGGVDLLPVFMLLAVSVVALVFATRARSPARAPRPKTFAEDDGLNSDAMKVMKDFSDAFSTLSNA